MRINGSEFESALGTITFPAAIAVSGGMDSLALLLLAQHVAQKNGGHIVALTVDHGLRAESKEEALQVQKWAQERGIEHVILSWEGEKPTLRIQEKAREARYRLLTDWCKNNGISTLLLGHHAQDQEETFWLRLSSGSGLDGLGGMRTKTQRDGMTFIRPLLAFSKERLKATLLAENQAWIQDPSNQNPRFFRGRLRSVLEEEGLDSRRLMKVMGKLQEDADFIRDSLHQSLQETIHIHEGGYLTLKRSVFETLHPTLQKRVISYVMTWFSGDDYPPRSIQVQGVIERLADKRWIASPPLEARNDGGAASLRGSITTEAIQKPFTSGGIYWITREKDILLLREKRAIKETLNLDELEGKTLWDQRFWINPDIKKIVSRETILAPLGMVPGLKKETQSTLSPRVWPTLPALWVKGKVVAVPHLCYDKSKCEMDLRELIYLKPLFHDSLTFTI
jgi:tRNA(Ile)-lysidine synthetase-like protein